MSSNILGYNGNPKIRRAYTHVAMSQHEVDEYEKCMNDPIYFIRTYMKIVVLGKGIQPFLLYDFQEDMIRTFQKERFVICKIPRQSGKTITTIGYLLHTILFNENYNIALLAHKGSAANGILGRLRLAYENLPTWLQSGVVEWNKGNIELENGSKIGAFATSADGLRSGSYDCVLLDEFSFVPNNIAEEFFTSTYPVITAGTDTKIIIVSTPKGMNHFCTMWMKAEKGLSDYFPIEVHWSAVPGRDQAWKEQTIRNTSAEQFQQEFETEFIGSSHTLINPVKMRQLIMNIENPIESIEKLDIYAQPEPGKIYAITVDVSEGQGLDASAFSVFDVSQIPYKQVAKYKNNKISSFLFPTVVFQAAMKYNEAFILVEINSIGLMVADTLHNELAYENLIKIKTKGKQGQQVSGGYQKNFALGLKQSTQTKRIGCANLKALIENDRLILCDADTITELTTFSASKQSYAAEAGSNDDLAMTMVIFAWMTSQKFFKETVSSDIRQSLQEEQMNLMDRDMVPFGVISNGLDDDNKYEQVGKDMWVKDRRNFTPWDDVGHLWNKL